MVKVQQQQSSKKHVNHAPGWPPMCPPLHTTSPSSSQPADVGLACTGTKAMRSRREDLQHAQQCLSHFDYLAQMNAEWHKHWQPM